MSDYGPYDAYMSAENKQKCHAPGNSCGRTSCNAARSANLNIVRPVVQGVSKGLSRGFTLNVNKK